MWYCCTQWTAVCEPTSILTTKCSPVLHIDAACEVISIEHSSVFMTVPAWSPTCLSAALPTFDWRPVKCNLTGFKFTLGLLAQIVSHDYWMGIEPKWVSYLSLTWPNHLNKPGQIIHMGPNMGPIFQLNPHGLHIMLAVLMGCCH